MAIADKLTYLDDTKQLIRGGLEAVGEYITDDTPFREYVTKLANSQRTLGSNFAGDSYDLLSPVNDLDFEGAYTLTRGSDGAFWNRHGILSAAGMDVKRVNHDPATLNSSADTFDLDTLSRWDVVVVNLGSANAYNEGQVVAVSDDADLNNCFYAEIKSIDADALTCHVTHVQGTGSISAWTVIKSEGLLIEEQRTNLLLWSEAIDDTAWVKENSTISVDSATSPDGNNTMDLIVPDAGTGVVARVRQNVTGITSGVKHTITGRVKSSGYRWVRVLATNFVNNASTWFDVIDGLVGVTDADSASIRDIGNGIYEYTVVATSSNTSSTVFPAHIVDSNGDTLLTSDGTSGIYIWGAQLEQGSFPTSYIKTESSQVTRSADNCSRTLGSEFNVSEGNLTVTAKAEIGDTIATLGTESIAADVDTEKEYTLNYSSDPSATTIDIMPSANGYIKSLRYIPREVV